MTDFFGDMSREWDEKNCHVAYEQMMDKVLNENLVQLHTMLMRTDMENYLGNQTISTEQQNQETASLFDYQYYEKELSRYRGDEER